MNFLAPLCRRTRHATIVGLAVAGIGIGIGPEAFGQQATTDWSPFSDNSLSELRPVYLPPLAAPLAVTAADQARTPTWLIRPSITLAETYTDNASGTGGGRNGDLFTTVSPDLFVSGQSARLQGVLNINPQFVYFLKNHDLDQIDANLLTTGSAVIVPGRLFLDEQGSVASDSRSGFRGLDNNTVIPASDRTQQYLYSVSPYAYIPFSGATDVELRYRFSQLLFDGNTGAQFSPITNQSLAPISNGTQQEGFAKLKTTALSDQVLLSLTADDTDFTAPGTVFSSQNIAGAVGASYRVAHALWATGSAGYQDLDFPDLPRVNYTGPTWEIGGRYAPSADRLAALSYGSYEGRLGFKGNLNYAVTPRISVFARYAEEVSTPQQQIIQNLPLVNQTTPGTTIDATTGLPYDLVNPNLPLENGVFFVKSLTGGAAAALGRNTVGVSFNFTNSEALAGPSPSQSSYGGSLSLTRALSPKMTGSALISFSSISIAAEGIAPRNDGRTGGAGLSLSYSFSETFQGRVSYALQVSSGTAFPTALVNYVTVALTKSF